MIEYQILDSYFGDIVLARLKNKIIFLEFIDNSLDVTLNNITTLYPDMSLMRVEDIINKFDELFDKHKFGWNKLSIKGTPLQLRVWEALFSLDFGVTVTYSDLAEMAGNERAVRAVASAVASNPISLIIPCHRVIPKSDKGYGNYRWGGEVKRGLIEWESSGFGIKREIFNRAKANYKEFSQGLIPTNNNTLIGVTVPHLREIAKQVLNTDARTFVNSYFNINQLYVYYEEIMVLGIVIANGPFSVDEKFSYYNKFIPLIDNWAVCDIFCGESKWLKKEPDLACELISKNINSEEEFRNRFAIILMLSQFVKQKYLSQIFTYIKNLKFRDNYYVDMAVAWLLATLGAKFPSDLFKFLSSSNLPNSVLKKTAQKMRDSKRVTPEYKIMITDIVKSKI